MSLNYKVNRCQCVVLGLSLALALSVSGCSSEPEAANTRLNPAPEGTGGTGVDPTVAVPPPTDPGVVTLRRLNRLEYNNSVKDLLGTTLRPADSFPHDTDAGFDTSSQALTVSPSHARLYVSAAEQLANDLVESPVESRPAVFVCDPVLEGEPCAQRVVQRLARRAFRRPVSDAELTPLYGLISQALVLGGSLHEGIATAVEAILLSPHFMLRVELDAAPASELPHPLSPHELAARLSFFLWSSIPDDELFTLADAGSLTDPARLEQSVTRLLSDARAAGLVDGFAKSWLLLDSLDKHIVDQAAFPAFNASLKAAMREETRLFFTDFLHNARPVKDMLNADFTFVDAALAGHYGLSHSGAPGFERVSTLNTQRFGVLTQGGVLTATSGSARTAPVKRGLWVLDSLLCAPPPPPPPDIPTLDDAGDGVTPQTVRAQLAAHRASPACAGCHQLLDPIGLALEHYDAVGAYRVDHQGLPIDASGQLVDGRAFADARELSVLLSADPVFSACLVEQLMTFALGRDFRADRFEDRAWVELIAARANERGGSLPTLIGQIVRSEPFVTRRGSAEP